MKRQIFLYFALLIAFISLSKAYGYTLTVTSDPQGARIYLLTDLVYGGPEYTGFVTPHEFDLNSMESGLISVQFPDYEFSPNSEGVHTGSEEDYTIHFQGTLSTQPWVWVNQAGSTGNDSGYSIATDGGGNSFIIGSYTGSISLGSTTLSGGSSFIAKTDILGNWLWAMEGPSGYISTDDSGNCFVAGDFSGSMTIGSITLTCTGYSDIFIAKIDSYGNWLWSTQAGGLYGACKGISTDRYGNCIITGSFTVSGDFSRVAKVDPDGNWLWANGWGGGAVSIYDIATDNVGNSYVCGSYSGEVSFGTLTISGDGGLLAKIDAAGNWTWATGMWFGHSAGYEQVCTGVSCDGFNNCYVTGSFITYYYGYPYSHGAIRKYDSINNLSWDLEIATISGSDPQSGISLYQTDSSGNSYVSLSGIIEIGSNTIEGYMTAKLDTYGNWIWASHITSRWIRGISFDANEHAYMTGSFTGTTNFGPTFISSNGGSDVFVSKMLNYGPLLAPTITELCFGNANVGYTEDMELTIANAGTRNLTLSSSSFHSDGFSFSVPLDMFPLQIPVGGSIEIPVTFIPQFIGPVSDTLYIQNNSVNTPLIKVTLTGSGLPMLGLQFGDVYMGSSKEMGLTLSNDGSSVMHLSSGSYYSGGFAFSVPDNLFPIQILAGSSLEIPVTFIPQFIGSESDTLYINNSSENIPTMKIHLSGAGVYVPPMAPENISIIMDSNNALITWDAVTETIFGTPITPDYYFIFNSNDPFSEFTYQGATDGLQYIHPMVGAFQQRMFYRVNAYKYYGRSGFDPADILKPGMTEEEVLRLLNGAAHANH